MLFWSLWAILARVEPDKVRYVALNKTIFILAGAVFTGLVFPELSEWFAPALYPSLFCIMLFTLVPIDVVALIKQFRALAPLSLAMVAVQMILMPLLVWALIVWINPNWPYAHYVFVTVCAGSIFGAPAFVRLLGIDDSIALLGVVFSTLLLPLSLPIMMRLMDGVFAVHGITEISFAALNFTEYGARLLIYIALPLVVSILYHEIVKRYVNNQTRVVYWCKALVTIALVIFAIAVMDGVTPLFFQRPAHVTMLFFWVMVVHIALFILPFVLFRYLGNDAAISAGMLSSYRNLGLVVAICGQFLSDEFLIFVGLWQIPMYLSPLVLSFVFAPNKG